MSIILPQQVIPLRNPYSVLSEQESDQLTTEHQDYYNYSNNNEGQDDGHDQMSVGSWSVIASTTGSDNEEEEDDEDDDEILLNEESIAASLTVSNLGDGFTDISKTLTATSINSANLAGRSDAWAIKVSKKKSTTRKEDGSSPSANASITGSKHEGRDGDEEMSLDEYYMQMTEHELSKSSKAVKLKNIRLATAYDKELSRVINSPDRKALPTRPIVSERSKTRGARLNTD